MSTAWELRSQRRRAGRTYAPKQGRHPEACAGYGSKSSNHSSAHVCSLIASHQAVIGNISKRRWGLLAYPEIRVWDKI
jgi:hypothetical protein